ncbi:MAG: anti-sigma factor domain-containing protein [Planctomycetaceae bacterium]
MNHERFLDLCAGYAVGSLDEADCRRLEEHLAGGCAECDAALADFGATVTFLAASAPPAAPPEAVRARLLAQARSARSRSALWGWAAAACFALVALALWMWGGRAGGLTGAWVVELARTEAGAADLRARAIFDPATASAILLFENYRAPEGRDFELWALRGGTPVSLGLLRADAEGRAEVRLRGLAEPAAIDGFAVSLEPAGGAPKGGPPTGPVVSAGMLR